MKGKLCVMKVGAETIEGFFISDKTGKNDLPAREEYVPPIRKEMVNMDVSVGDVLYLDYSWRSISVFEKLDAEFREQKIQVKETIELDHIVIADSDEEARKKLKDAVLKDSGHVLGTSRNVKTVSVEVL